MNRTYSALRSFYRLMSEQAWWRAVWILLGLTAVCHAAEIWSRF
jgi:hypothetical protein